MPVGRPALLTLLLLAGPAVGQNAVRLDRAEPEIRIDARGRNGVCDVLQFTPDGHTLLAAGEDKVVHRWDVGLTGLTPAGPPLTWNTFRERRGSIYALALDPTHNRLAVAGFGKKDADVSVIALRTGQVADALDYPKDGPGGRSANAAQTVWALAFSPDGKELATGDDAGNVWAGPVGGKAAARLLAAGVRPATLDSRVVWVGYLNNRVAYAKRDGGVYDTAGNKLLHKWGAAVGLADRVVASGDGRVLAARPYKGHDGNGVEVWWPATDAKRTVLAPDNLRPERTALDADGKRLAVGYVDESGRATGFEYDRPGEVRVYDLTASPPREVAKSPRLPACPHQIAFHPKDLRRLATADAADHGTTLWQLAGADLKPADTERSDAPPVWAVGLTADGRYLSYKTAPVAAPPHPNHRADPEGKWTSFDLADGRRGWAAGPHAPVAPVERTKSGWRLDFDTRDEFNWTVVEPNGKRHGLAADGVWQGTVDIKPRCYTFLPHPAGDPAARLAVGHLWGISVYDLRPGQKPVRVRKLVGHAGYVTAVAPAYDGKGLVSAGRDNTIALWNLAGFDQQELFGAAFEDRGGRLFVAGDPAPGSPADEAGLTRDDEVVGLMVNSSGKLEPRANWLAELRNPHPERELGFKLSRKGAAWPEPQWTKTKLLHRPIAKFVPFRDREWVLYTYRQCYYDCSVNGDRAIQWVVSKDQPDQAPDVFPVDAFRKALKQPDKVRDVLTRQVREPALPILVEKHPPAVTVAVDKQQVQDGNTVTLTVTVSPQRTPSGRVNTAEVVEVWLNGHHRLDGVAQPPADQPADRPFVTRVTIKAELLRTDGNRLTALALAADGGWGTSAAPASVQVVGRAAPKRHLYGLAAGIDKYEEQTGQTDLNGAFDAYRLQTALKTLRAVGGFQPGGDDALPLLQDEKVTRQGVLAAIEQVGKRAGVDDLFVLALSGHGFLGDATGRLRPAAHPEQPDDLWYMLTPTHHTDKRLSFGRGDLRKPDRVRELCLNNKEILAALGRLNCPTLLILDSCHSGKAAGAAAAGAAPMVTKNAPDRFRRHGFGPVVLAACAANQEAIDSDSPTNKGAIFTTALIAALGNEYGKADKNADGRLTADELFRFVERATAKAAGSVNLGKAGGPEVYKPQNAVATPGAAELARLVVAEKKSE